MSMERQILVVDDEAVIRLHIRDILTAAGYSVIEGGDGVEGLDTFKQHMEHIALVLLDLNMPNMTGYEMLAEIQILDADVDIMVITGYDPNKERLPGVRAIMRKPIKKDELLRVVQGILAGEP